MSSLKEFHATFHEHCKRYFPVESLFENVCEEYEKCVQHVVGFSSVCVDERCISIK